jgi:alpha-D-ribose 1-methylphosphonate 5-triphosphate synthase subunit PhnG
MTTVPTPAARARALARATVDLDEAFAAEALAALGLAAFELEAEPRIGLAMMTVRDPFDTVFCLGEALVTEAVVRSGEVRGWGAVLGDAPQRAVLCAALDLLGRTGNEAALARAAELLGPESSRHARARDREAALVARTRVQFDLMPGK